MKPSSTRLDRSPSAVLARSCARMYTYLTGQLELAGMLSTVFPATKCGCIRACLSTDSLVSIQVKISLVVCARFKLSHTQESAIRCGHQLITLGNTRPTVLVQPIFQLFAWPFRGRTHSHVRFIFLPRKRSSHHLRMATSPST